MQVKFLIFRKGVINLKIITIIVLFCNSITIIGQNVYTVTKTTDPDPFVYSFNNNDTLCPPELLGTLQWALRKINANVSSSVINFNISGGGVQTIIVNYVLPGGRSNLVIDGTTQPGYSIGNPKIKIVQGPDIQNNLLISFYGASNVTIKGLAFLGVRGVNATNSSNFLIKDNVFGDNEPTSDYGHRVILFQSTNHNVITNNKFLHCGISLVGYDAEKLLGGDNLVEKNSFLNTTQVTGNGFLVEIDGSIHNKVTQNTFVNHQIYYWIKKSIDLRVGGNNLKAPPSFSNISNLSNVTGTAMPGDIIELFGSTGPENANEYLKSVETDINGDWSADLTGLKWTRIAATATDANNNTSTIGISFQACPDLSDTVPCSPMDFTTANWSVFAGDTVGFQNTSINCNNSYPINWNFGDGSPIFGGDSTLSNVNPNHVFVSEGIFYVQLFANNANGCQLQSITKQITVNSTTKHLEFCHSNIACTNKSVTFDNKSTGYSPSTNFLWDYGDGTGSSSTYIHTYASSGTYSVTLTAPDTIATSTIYVFDDCLNPCNIPPVITASTSNPTICAGSSATLSVSGGNTYSWAPAIGLNTTIGDSVMASPPITTTYTITGTSVEGCIITTEITITVLTMPISGDTTICFGDTLTLVASGMESYIWTRLHDISSLGSNLFSSFDSTLFSGEVVELPLLFDSVYSSTIVSVPQSNMTYTLIGSSSSFGCSNTQLVNVVVSEPLIAHAGNDTALSSGESAMIGGVPSVYGGTVPYSYSWSPSTYLDSEINPNPVSTPTVITNYVLEVTDSLGCLAKDEITVRVYMDLIINEGENQIICPGTSTELGGYPMVIGGLAPYTYAWEPSDSLISSSSSNPYTNMNSNTTFTVTVTDSKGSVVTGEVTVDFFPLPIVDAGENQTVCSGSMVNLGGSPTVTGGSPPYFYLWTSTSVSVSDEEIENPSSEPLVSTIYTLTISDNNKCTVKDDMGVYIQPAIEIFAGNDRTILLGDTIVLGGAPTVLAGTPPYLYSWTPSGTLSDSQISNPMAWPIASTEYALTVTDSSNCSLTAHDTVIITIDSLPIAIAGQNVSICLNDTAILGGTPTVIGGMPPYTYAWTPTTGLSDPSVANPLASPVDSTEYSLIISDNNGYFAYDTIIVAVNTLPIVNAGNDTTVLADSTFITLGAYPTASGGTPPYMYYWLDNYDIIANEINKTFDDSNPLIAMSKFSDTTTYYLTVVDRNQCAATDSMKVNFDNKFYSACNIDSCTWRVTGIDSTIRIINEGQKMCIDRKGVIKGHTTLNIGGVICNSGELSPTNLIVNGGGLYNNSIGIINIAGDLNLGDSSILMNDGDVNVAGKFMVESGAIIINEMGIIELGSSFYLNGGSVFNYNGISMNSQNFSVSDSGIFVNEGFLRGVDTVKNFAFIGIEAESYLYTNNLINYSSGIIKRINVETDSLYVDTTTYGNIWISNQSINYGEIHGNIDIFDNTTSGTGPVFLDFNSGIVDTTITYKSAVGNPDSIEVTGVCPTVIIKSSGCSGDVITYTASSSKKFNNYEFLLNNERVQDGSDSIYVSSDISLAGDSIVVIASSYDTPCKETTSFPYFVPLKFPVTIIGDSVAFDSTGVTLIATNAQSYIWTTIEDTVLSEGAIVVVFPTQTSTYFVSAIDSNGCTSSASFEVVKHLSFGYTKVNPSPSNPYSGEIVLLDTGGELPITYLWDTGETTPYLYDINSGTYQVTIIDAKGEVLVEEITLD